MRIVKKSAAVIYIVIILAVCLIPFAGMLFAATDATTENKTLASFPSLTSESGVNWDFLPELGAYFEDHFAFREALVNADAEIQSSVFHVSNADTIITGEDDWLYYSATLDDYLGQNLMTDRAVYAAAHNLALMQEYAENTGAKFAVTVAPNKNTLYGDNMPYYDSQIVSSARNMDSLQSELEKQGVNYVDLFTVFEEQNEVLYLKRDSHWNNKGAVLAYNTILDAMDISHDNLETVPVLRTKTYIGDLNSMLYPLTAEPEWNYTYDLGTSDIEDVEDTWIETENEDGEGVLLMFRDSFGNTLLPLMANTFASGNFSWGTPYAVGRYTEECSPDVVIVEKVERNVDEFASEAPIMEGPERELTGQITEAEDGTTCDIERSEYDASYISVSGILDEEHAEEESNVYIRLILNGEEKIFEAFLTADGESEYGYTCYLSADTLADGADAAALQVLVSHGTDVYEVHAEEIRLGGEDE